MLQHLCKIWHFVLCEVSHMGECMCRYVFAAATADVWHQQVDYSANLVPGYGPIGESCNRLSKATAPLTENLH